MKNASKQTRTALWVSAVSLVLCAAMLLGVTLAWFSDVASNKGNKIEAGTLHVGFYSNAVNGENGDTMPVTAAGWKNLKTEQAPIFVMWPQGQVPAQPGDALTRYIKVENQGSIPLKYELSAVVDDGGLGDAIAFTFTQVESSIDGVTSSAPVVYPTVPGSTLNGTVAQGKSSTRGDYVIYKAELKFNESAGNTYQGKTFAVDFVLSATQTNDNATVVNVHDEASLQAALQMDNCPTIVLVKDIVVTGSVSLSKAANIELNGYTLTADSVVVSVDKMETVDIANGIIVLRSGLGVQRETPDQLNALNVTNVVFSIEGVETQAAFIEYVKNISGTLYVPAVVQLPNAALPLYVNEIVSNLYYDLNHCDKIVISEGVTKIGNHDFVRLGNVTEVVMPRTLATIGGEFLRDSQKLQHIVFPQAVTAIGQNCLMNAMGLQTVTFQSVTPPTIASGFMASAHNIAVGTGANPVKIYVPKGSKAAYQAAIDTAVGTQPNTHYVLIEQ